MADLKTHAPTVADLVADDSDRAENGAGIVVVILACVVLLGLILGGGVVGFVVYVGHVRQLQEERARLMALADMERAQAEFAAQNAEAAATQAELAELAAVELPNAIQATQPAPTPNELFQGEIEALNQAVLEHPDDPKVWQNRARAFHRWRNWKEAAEDYERFLELSPHSLWMRLDAAVTRFANGDREAYLEHCKLAEERLATKTEPTVEHNRAARVLCLAPGALTSGDSLLVMAQHEPEKNPGKWWLLEPMLALQYRTGRYDDALQTIDELRPLATFSGQRAATEIWAAMTFHQLGRRDEARAALAAAEQHVASGLPPPGGTNAGGDAVIIALTMMDEAKGLIEGSLPKESPPEPVSSPAP